MASDSSVPITDAAAQLGVTRSVPVLIDNASANRFCSTTSSWYDNCPLWPDDDMTLRRYKAFNEEILGQFRILLDCGLQVRPWLNAGQPYANSDALRRGVARTNCLFVYLTSEGHGSPEDVGKIVSTHPMLIKSPIRLDGVPFTYNDLFRAVHDAFGHILFANSFGVVGELRAALCHSRAFSNMAIPVLLAETVGQISWYYFEPTGYRRVSADRRYPPQKPAALPTELQARFLSLWSPSSKSAPLR